MEILKQVRTQRGLSQRALARNAAVSFKGLQLMESKDHDWRISTLRKVASALNLPGNGIDLLLARFISQPAYAVRAVSMRIVESGFDSWPIHLMDFVDTFRSARDALLVADPPIDETEARVRCLLASTVEHLCDEVDLKIPWWCAGIGPLREPWFVAGVENLKATALLESPSHFRKRNVFVMGNFLDRA